jgi:hypothetical protein
VCPSNRSIVRAIGATASNSARPMQVRFFIYKSNCDFDPSHPSVFLSNTPNLKKKKKSQRNFGGYISPSFDQSKMCKNPPPLHICVLQAYKQCCAQTHFYVTSTKVVVVKVDNSVVNLMVPCQKDVEKNRMPSGQRSSRAEDTAEQRTVKSRHHTGSRMPGKVRRQPRAPDSSVPVAEPGTYRW